MCGVSHGNSLQAKRNTLSVPRTMTVPVLAEFCQCTWIMSTNSMALVCTTPGCVGTHYFCGISAVIYTVARYIYTKDIAAWGRRRFGCYFEGLCAFLHARQAVALQGPTGTPQHCRDTKNLLCDVSREKCVTLVALAGAFQLQREGVVNERISWCCEVASCASQACHVGMQGV